MIPVLSPHLDISDFISFFKIGKKIDREFENHLKNKFNSKFCITFFSGRAGLYNILKANNVQNKSVLVTAYTCCVVTEAIIQSGNTPIFIDTKDDSFNAEILKKYIESYNSNLGAILITNLYGVTSFSNTDVKKIDKKILVILDDALSPGDLIEGSKVAFDYSFISCEVRKPFSCLGGGIVFTNNKEKYRTLKDYVLRTRIKMDKKKKITLFILSLSYFFAFKPFIYSATSFIRRKTNLLDSFFSERNNDLNKKKPEYSWDMCDYQKRIGRNQLKKINYLLNCRRKIGNLYFQLFSPIYPWVNLYWKINTPFSHIPFLHSNRDELQEYLLKNGIDTEKYFDYCVPELYQSVYSYGQTFPRAKYLSGEMINLPINVGLTKKAIFKIVDRIKEFDIYIKNNKGQKSTIP